MAFRDADPAKSIPQVASELWELSTAYARQETLDPLRGLARYLRNGLAGAILLGIGSVLMLLGLLRFLQTETDTALTGNLSWVPYPVVVAAAAAMSWIVIRLIVKREGPGL